MALEGCEVGVAGEGDSWFRLGGRCGKHTDCDLGTMRPEEDPSTKMEEYSCFTEQEMR